MEYSVYVDKANAGNALFEAGDIDGAIAAFEELVKSDISDIDKSIMSYNIAKVCEKGGYIDLALEWLDYGIALEAPHLRCLVREHKAAFLAERHRDAEAIAIYEALYTLPYITEADKQRIWGNLSILRNPRPA